MGNVMWYDKSAAAAMQHNSVVITAIYKRIAIDL